MCKDSNEVFVTIGGFANDTVWFTGDAGANWERLRELWNANGARLDEVIERIPAKRLRTKFARMPKTSYPAIINALADAKFISEAARKASLDLNTTFMSYKPRNRKIPDAAVGAIELLDKQLAQEIGGYLPDDDPSPSTLSTPASVHINVAAPA